MRLVKSTMNRKIGFFLLLGACFYSTLSAQENSPYSRYGLGDISPQSNILNRGMGGLSAAYSDMLYVNFLNPASYSAFRINKIQETGETVSGRVVLDAGINLDNRTIREANRPDKFTSPNTYFSYLQLGIPLRKNWGMALGLRPMTKVGYRIQTEERLPVDSAVTQYRGEGGSYLASIGTGFAVKNFSAGFNFGYLFGKKDYATERTLINDTVAYARGNFQTKTSFGGIYLSGGLQQKIVLTKRKNGNDKDVLRLGVYGSLKQNLNASKDFLRETFTRDQVNGYLKVDSVYAENNVSGEIVYPATLGFGFIYENAPTAENGGFQFGADYLMTKWTDYRFYQTTDLVSNSSELRIGAQILPSLNPSIRNYWRYVSYRAGVTIGKDYINLGQKLPTLGISAGISLPVLNMKDAKARFRTQFTVVNLAFEYIRRGNNSTPLKENLFRLSAGFSLSDNWFSKRKYN